MDGSTGGGDVSCKDQARSAPRRTQFHFREQIEAIKRFCVEKGYTYTGCHWDLKSGSTADRKGLLTYQDLSDERKRDGTAGITSTPTALAESCC